MYIVPTINPHENLKPSFPPNKYISFVNKIGVEFPGVSFRFKAIWREIVKPDKENRLIYIPQLML